MHPPILACLKSPLRGQSVIVAQIDGAALITAGKGKQQALGIGIVHVVARLATDRRGGRGRHPLATSAGMVVGTDPQFDQGFAVAPHLQADIGIGHRCFRGVDHEYQRQRDGKED